MLQQRNRSASNYAKAKVQQIRKKFGYTVSTNNNIQSVNTSIVSNFTNISLSPSTTTTLNNNTHVTSIMKQNKQNTIPITPQHTSSSIAKDKHNNKCYEHLQIGCSSKISDNVNTNNNNSTNLNRNIFVNTNNKHQPQPQQYENRIKNIDAINKKIQSILKQRQRLDNYANINMSTNINTNKNLTISINNVVKQTQQKINYIQNQYQQQPRILLTPTKQIQTQTHIQSLSVPLSNNTNIPNKNNNIIRNQKFNQKQIITPIHKFGNFKQQHKQKQKHQNIYIKQLQNKLNYGDIQPITSRPQYIGLNSKYIVSVELPNTDNTTIPITNSHHKQTQMQKNQQIKQQFKQGKPDPRRRHSLDQNYNKKVQKIQQEQQICKKQTIKLAQALNQFISKDQNLRYAKWVFSQWQDTNKWTLLQNKRPKYSLQQLQKIFILCPQQHNPFFQYNEPPSEACLQNLIKFYEQSNIYWQKNVRQCVRIQNLQNQYFNVRDLDLGKKGYLTVEDIVCFVNLYTGKFYRNRDAIGLFKRFVAGEKGQRQESDQQVKYQWFLETVTK